MIKRILTVALFTAMLSGCADKDWMIRKPAVESTIGNDPNKAPAGKVIPPPGIGCRPGCADRPIPRMPSKLDCPTNVSFQWIGSCSRVEII